MQITRWDPLRELEVMSDRLNRMFQRPFDIKTGAEEEVRVADWSPVVDIEETEKEYIVKAELPEVNKDEVKVEVREGVLTLAGERNQEKEEKGKTYHRIERSYGKFVRSFSIPSEVDDTKLSAQFKNGVLQVHLPKSEKARPRAIAVKVASE